MKQKPKHSIWSWFGKALLAGVIALTALNFLCTFYYRMPGHINCPDGVTDFRWEPNYSYINAVEGMGWGRTNNEGYTNAIDYQAGDAIDVLLVGSSHMDGAQVPASDKAIIILNSLLPAETVYNIGVAEHGFLTCFQNLSAAVNKYTPKKYVIVETTSVEFSASELSQALSNERAELPSYQGTLLGVVERIPLFRTLNRQFPFFKGFVNRIRSVIRGRNEAAQVSAAAPVGVVSSTELLSSILSEMSETSSSSGAKLIIAYHPATTLNSNGTITFSSTPAQEDAFAALCKKNGILFLNMRERFQMEYDENHILPYGFANTSVGSGHLNRYGHQMMAEELCALMEEEGL